MERHREWFGACYLYHFVHLCNTATSTTAMELKYSYACVVRCTVLLPYLLLLLQMRLHLAIALSAILVYALVQYAFNRFYPTEECTPDEAACAYFSSSYQQARARFRKSVSKRSLSVTSLAIVDDYTLDVVVVPGDSERIVLHSSGLHGIEGYCGSAIQVAALERSLPKDHPTMIFFHVVNPYGMAHHRRVNENNVDLNRHGLTEEEWKTYAANHFNREAYTKFVEWMNPEKPTDLNFVLTGLRLLLTHGHDTLKAALVGGQYHKQEYLSYGGSSQRRETSYVKVQEFLESQRESLEAAKTVTWIDVHTGLGPFGEDTLMVDHTTDADVLEAHFPERPHTVKVTQGYEQVKGFFMSYFTNMFVQPHQSWVALAQEFGTLPTVLVGKALIQENAGRKDDDQLRWVFYPQSRAWRARVLERGLKVLDQAIARE